MLEIFGVQQGSCDRLKVASDSFSLTVCLLVQEVLL